MKESAWQRLWIGLGLLAICVQISYSETVALPQDALVIVAVVDYSGQRPVVAWPDTWTGLDGQPLGDAKDSRFILAMSEKTLKESRIYQGVILDGGHVWYEGQSWTLSYYVPLPGESLADVAAHADKVAYAKGHHRPDKIPNPELEDLLVTALHHQIDREYASAIVEYGELYSEGFQRDLVFQLMLHCHDKMNAEELQTVVAHHGDAANKMTPSNLPDLCFDECPVYDVNWPQTLPPA